MEVHTNKKIQIYTHSLNTQLKEKKRKLLKLWKTNYGEKKHNKYKKVYITECYSNKLKCLWVEYLKVMYMLIK